MNRLSETLQKSREKLLAVYYTAGFPQQNSTMEIALALQQGGADIIEIGMPFSDPVADGPTIQDSNKEALNNGMTLKVLFNQLKSLREKVTVPVVLMGYLNPVMQYGIENFCRSCQEVGIDGLILPDLPVQEYQEEYKSVFSKYGLSNVFLITPQTTQNRIREIDAMTSGAFIYAVSSASITGAKTGISATQEEYLARLKDMGLNNPFLVGFGIADHKAFAKVSEYAAGAIIGSAFINRLKENRNNLTESVVDFVKKIKNQNQ